ncbi:MAG TPA: efflux RND transporter permease subunit [Thiotrichaceae bacterium]|jgi:multidrug efflux pump subunit AcrB|nr:efflux RND transporter permease subunit [Thiotrichaceae bacterium]HIM08670.1 efflux RND transporter permease subunit [Gammaproteobacteria bacterium]
MTFIRFSINNPLIVNLSLVIILIIGVLAWRALPQEIFPAIALDMVSISTEFEGASPAEVEQQVTLPVEEEFEDSQDIDYIASISREGVSSVFIKLKQGSNVDDFMREARTSVDRINDLPGLAEEPELVRITAKFPVITLTLYGNIANAELYEMAEDIRRKMQLIPGVANVAVAGDRDWEIWVEVDPHELAAMDVPLETITAAIRNNLSDQPGGSIKAMEGDVRLRGTGVTSDPDQIERIVLRTNANGGKLLLGEVAKISRRFEESETYARFAGKPSVNLTVTKTADSSTILVSDLVKEFTAELQQTLPAGVNVDYHSDMAEYVRVRLNTVKSSGLVGLMLVLFSLYVLLNFRIAAITAFGIPVSFLFAIILMFYFGYTINMVSLFAFLIVLGMIVDDAIIVTENIYRHIEDGMQPLDAAALGAKEVFWPVVVSTLTTVAAFLPMFAIGGILGEFIKVIPVVVCCALLGSLIEAFVVLPSHAGHLLRKEKTQYKWIDWKKFLEKYARVLHWSALNRYTVVAISTGVLAISLTYAYTRLPFQMFGDVEVGQFFVNIEAPNTYSLEDSLLLAEKLENKTSEIIAEEELKSLLTNVGISMIDENRSKRGSNLIQLVIDLEKSAPQGFIERWVNPLVSLDFSIHGKRKRSTDEIIDLLRASLPKVPGVQRMGILKPAGGPAGDDIEIGVISDDLVVLKQKSDEIRDYLRRMSGVQDVRHDQDPGKMEYKYALNDRGKRLGLTQTQLSNAVRSGYLGNEVVHVTWEDKRLPVRLIYPELLRKRSGSLAELPIVLASGKTVYLGDVADITIGRGLNEIRRRNNQRMTKITADVDSAITTATEVIDQVDKEFRPAPGADYKLIYLGEKKNAQESFKGMYQALIIALVMIFFMLTVLFKSLIDPLVVMIAIPFGIIGVVIGHALFGYNLQFLSMVGVLALSGIIVNDSLIMVDFIKRMRREGEDRIMAVVDAGRVRARPIILTTVTTFLGISPLIFFASGQTAFLSPMAVSLGFGLVFATALILLTLPCFYLIADDIRSWIFGMEIKAAESKLVS